MAYCTETIPITLSDLQGHSPAASLIKCNFSYICVAVDKIATDSTSHGRFVVAERIVANVGMKYTGHRSEIRMYVFHNLDFRQNCLLP